MGSGLSKDFVVKETKNLNDDKIKTHTLMILMQNIFKWIYLKESNRKHLTDIKETHRVPRQTALN